MSNQKVLSGVRHVITPLELDILIPDQTVAIEYCGLYWHSESNGKTSDYHLIKDQKCKEKNIKLLTIFEDEWMRNRPIVESRIKYSLGLTAYRVFARKCEIVEIEHETATEFFNQTHSLQYAESDVYLGLEFDSNLVFVMSFKQVKGNEWQITRFSSLLDTSVVGGASKVFKYFVDRYQPSSVFAESETRWGRDPAVFSKMGMTCESITGPELWYGYINKRIHHADIENHKEVNKIHKLLRIWDCGKSTWTWRNVDY